MVEHHFIILHAVFHILKSTPMLIFFASGDVNMKLMLTFLPLSNIDSHLLMLFLYDKQKKKSFSFIWPHTSL